MNRLILGLTVLTAGLTIAANVLLRMGLIKAGGLGVSGRGFLGDLYRLALEPIFVIGVISYGGAALLWFYVLSNSTLSVAYVLLVSIAFIGVTVLDTAIFGASFNLMKIAGVGVILCGILLVALSSVK